MHTILPNPLPGTFNRDLIFEISANINRPHDVILTPASLTIGWHRVLETPLETDLLLIGVTDNLEYDQDYDWWDPVPQEPREFKFLREMHLRNPGVTIIALVTGSHYPADYFYPLPIHLVDWAAIQENDVYPLLHPVVKDFDSAIIGINLNRQMRQHRLALISYLFGLELDRRCQITAFHVYKQLSKMPSRDFLDHNSWQFEERHESAKQCLMVGWHRIATDFAERDLFAKPRRDQEAYPMMPDESTPIVYDNFTNFETNLRPLYEKSFVEIVSCNRYVEPTVSIDEKMINSIYARNFPVVVGSRGTVAWYRSFGIDMFDDVVDHGYDTIENPIDRLCAAVDLNRHLLENADTTKSLWKQMESRFNQRVEHAKTELYENFRKMTLHSCNQVISAVLINPFQDR